MGFQTENTITCAPLLPIQRLVFKKWRRGRDDVRRQKQPERYVGRYAGMWTLVNDSPGISRLS